MKWKCWCNPVNEYSEDEHGEIQQRLLDKKKPAKHRGRSRTPHFRHRGPYKAVVTKKNPSELVDIEDIKLDISDTEDPSPPVIYLWCTIFKNKNKVINMYNSHSVSTTVYYFMCLLEFFAILYKITCIFLRIKK